MERDFDHTILIVDADKRVETVIDGLLENTGLTFIHTLDGEQGILEIKKAKTPFSIVLCDQLIPGMNGHEFLGKVSKITPDTVRFLTSGRSDLDMIIKAVNKGSIDRYISKPWDADEFIKAIKTGLEHYELATESKRLFILAKEQNAKLYTLAQELKEKTDKHKKCLDELDQEIEAYKKKIEIEKDGRLQQKKMFDYIAQTLKEEQLMEQEAFNGFAVNTIAEVSEQFQNIAVRYGFKNL